MSTTTFGPLRSKLPRKPWIKNANLCFWYCATCSRIVHEYLSDHAQEHPATAQNAREQQAPLVCCGGVMEHLHAAPVGEIVPELEVDYDIVGGFNDNAVKVYWNATAVSRPVWIALQTYTGVYLKHVPPAKMPPLTFPLSDEDAYTYCDRSVCEKCLYCCKKGCVLYLYMGERTLAALPLDKIAAYFRNKSV